MMQKTLFTVFCVLCFTFCVFSQEKTAEENAVVYFYSYATSTTLGQVRKPVFLDDVEIADIRPERYFIVRLSPGKHTFNLKNKKFGGIEKDFKAGETYYLRMEWRTDAKLKPAGITLVGADSGAFDIKQLKPVEKKNVRNSDLVFLTLEDLGKNNEK